MLQSSSGGGFLPGRGVCLVPGGGPVCLVGGVCLVRGVLPAEGGGSPRGFSADPSVYRITDMCKNITSVKICIHRTSYRIYFYKFLHTGRERLIRSHSSARFCFELSGNSNKTKACNSNSDQNFELEISLN